MNRLKVTIFILLSLLFGSIIYASDQEEFSIGDEEAEFDVNEVIMHHIKDTHSWHILSYKDKEGEEYDVAIPLPVILLYDGHLDIFMSSDFHHGEEPVTKGDRTYVLHHETIYVLHDGHADHGELDEKPLDFSITRNVAAILISSLLLLWIFISVARFYRKNPNTAPKGLAGFLEPVILFVRDEIVLPNMSKKDADKYIVYLLSVFFFILINNLLGLIPIFPGASNVTGNIAVTMTLALFTLIITNINGSKDYWKHIFATPDVPVFVLPILIIVEIIGIFTKPFALMVRLFANITAGHIIILSLISIIFIFKSTVFASVSVPFGLFMSLLEILVAFLQAFIFTMLSALFIGMAVQKHH
ncbi:F0F1 ATP synthase subunit A [Saccharicrinis sp. FJH62]|uniref:F0F1 ATP synthase subunit A n=1 Tax=Saccharicrinis sp. FJH62 TaxID=3344657 RepID=UPI0035D44107